MTMDDLPYHFINGIPYDILYKRALDCYTMISAGLRDIIIEKYVGRMHEDEELSPRAWVELCFVGFGIVLYHLVKDDSPQRSTEIIEACIRAGISEITAKRVKGYLGIRSIKEQDEWYWTL